MGLGITILGLVVVGVVFVLTNRRGNLRAAALAILLLAVATGGLAFLAVATDYRDADGFGDCWPNCTTLQDAVGSALFLAPVVAIIAFILLLASSFARRRS